MAAFSSICRAAGSPVEEKAAMVAEMQAAVNAVALRHGNIAFTQIFTNEPQRAAAVRQRFMEIERADNLSKRILDLEAQAKKLEEAAQASEAIVADLDRKIAARKLELAAMAPAESGK